MVAYRLDKDLLRLFSYTSYCAINVSSSLLTWKRKSMYHGNGLSHYMIGKEGKGLVMQLEVEVAEEADLSFQSAQHNPPNQPYDYWKAKEVRSPSTFKTCWLGCLWIKRGVSLYIHRHCFRTFG